MNRASFRDRIVVVTGGSKGIGRQLVEDLAGAGSRVVFCAERPDGVERALTELRSAGLAAEGRVCDVRDSGAVERFVNEVAAKYGRVDLLVNNAGYAVYRPFEESSSEEVLDIVDVNLGGAMRFAKAVIPIMTANGGGRIVNVASVAGSLIITPNAAYCAAKHGMVAWSQALRYELERFNIRVNVVCPGLTATSFHDDRTFRRRDPYRTRKRQPLSASRVSAAIISAIEKDKPVSYVPSRYSVVVWAMGVFPALSGHLWSRIAAKRIRQLYEQITLGR